MKTTLGACSALFVLALPFAAAAQTTVDSVIVTARPDSEDPAVVADARRRLSETPGAVSVIAAESFEDRFALALDDMLRDAPGVFAQKKWGGDTRLSIRGSGIGNANHNRGLLIAQDGLPLNEADGYGDSQIADPLLTRHVEVYRGGNALRFGGATLGGAVNMVTPTGKTAPYDNRVRIDGGSFGLLRQHAALARTMGPWDGFVAATNQTGQGPRSQSQQNIQFGSLNLGRELGEGEIRFTLSGAHIKQEINGALTAAQFAADPDQPAAGNVTNDYARDLRGLRGVVSLQQPLSDTLSVSAGVYAVWKELDHPIFQVIDQESRNYGAFARLDWDGEVAGRRADAYAGLWGRSGDLDSHFYVNNHGARGALRSISYQNATALDLFAEGRLFVSDRVALVAGATYGQAERDYRSVAVPGVTGTFNLDDSKDFDWLAPRIGLLWEAPDGVQVFANVTRSAEPPNFGSLSPTGVGFAPVEAQEAVTFEIGTRGRRGALTWDLTFYHAELEKEMLQFSVSPDRPATTFNADETYHRGIEAALDWRLAEAWRLRQSYTWSDFRFRDDAQYGDNRLPVAPEHFYRAELRYDAPAGWFVAPSVEWSPQGAWVDFRNTLKSPSYAIANLNLGWTAPNGISLFLDLRNLTDEAYVSNVQPVILAAPTTAAYWPGDRRSIFAGVVLDF
ncbi:MAG: TonB-dependent receptor [Phenylobacterium sp.]|uniref:TonB-dependent receptor family protein n=1 Tax=Phenylobacterium sp. TaxID=1871053 RepID=UPI002736E757|nr:TonB-dependent receptor [Phenylobacterium sp.]MDP1642154.1 TonB-dependent receptor [Phenylobacterium sp.]MDP3115616.1 TonB-dependent receptor [Phenylobacterium sp.]